MKREGKRETEEVRGMDVKGYLAQYGELDKKVERYKERLAMINASIENTSIELDGMPKGTGTSSPTETAAIELIEIKAKLERYILVFETMRQQILDEIEKVPEPIYRELLYSRYIKGLRWEEVVDRVSDARHSRRKGGKYSKDRYTSAHVMGPMHGRALQSFENVIRKKLDDDENILKII